MSDEDRLLNSEDRLLTPSEVAVMFRVDPRTVTRWAKANKITSIRTLGGHRRYREAEIRRILQRPGDGPPVSKIKGPPKS